ncbi:MAG: DUF2163 domain-containing protein [Novosphingobium sp.]
MSRVWFAGPLETAATFWRVLRRDGVTLGFATHDRDLRFGGVLHRAAPGLVPSAIRRSADLQPDSAEVEGALSHEAICAADLALGRYDGARILIGLVDWETLEHEVVYRGTIGTVAEEAGRFTAELASRKAELQLDPIPRTSPTCRAEFCGPGCALSPAAFDHPAALDSHAADDNAVTLGLAVPAERLVGGVLRWFDGPYAGQRMTVAGRAGEALILDRPLDRPIPPGARALVREGCDRTLATCAARFGNALNFQGEPFLPGNDQVARYATPGSGGQGLGGGK